MSECQESCFFGNAESLRRSRELSCAVSLGERAVCRPAVPSAGRRRVGMSGRFSDRRGTKTRACGLAAGSSPATGRLSRGLTSPKFLLEMGGGFH